MPRPNLAALEKRLDDLERRIDYVVMWLPRNDKSEHAGWECLPGNGLSEIVWRAEGESDADLDARAQQAIKRLRDESGAAGPVCYAFGVNAQGVSL
ncbi:MAG: hypothetical protein U9Q35_03060 [Pseudomonadota bacterium]|nr:hypothetical protein [Pseudomonadota bacterium]